ncbi:MAG: hypothetical protein HC799_19610 [Limnothrix sp. RL_2_0]|nr:hypothetical protein [Limnothrix sp. RL_2_0]
MFKLAGGDGVGVALGEDHDSDGNPTIYLGTQNGPIFRFITGYTSIRPTGTSSQFVTYFYLDPDNNNVLYYAALSRLLKTNNALTVTPTTWDDLGAGLQNIRSMATTRGTYDPDNSYLFIGDQGGNVLRIKDPQNATSLVIDGKILHHLLQQLQKQAVLEKKRNRHRWTIDHSIVRT